MNTQQPALENHQLSQYIWNKLDRQQWPDELASIKPKKWDVLDAHQKGKVVLENLGQIIYHVTLLTNDSKLTKDMQPRSQQQDVLAMHPNYIYP